jgi:hypothetical protein
MMYYLYSIVQSSVPEAKNFFSRLYFLTSKNGIFVKSLELHVYNAIDCQTHWLVHAKQKVQVKFKY